MVDIQDTPFGKMFPELFQATEEMISESFSQLLSDSADKGWMFLNLQDGNTQERFWARGGASRGDFLTRNFGESPNEERESSLSQVLQTNVPERYYLSARACEGILRRAESRGKKLPKMLEDALKAQSAFKNEQDARGGGKGLLIQNEHVGALSTLNNQAVCANVMTLNGGEVAETLDAHYYLGCGSRGGKGTRSSSRPAGIGGVGVDIYNLQLTGETAVTLTANVGGTTTSGAKVLTEITPKTICMGRGGYDEQSIEEDLSPTLKCTHDGVPAIVERTQDDTRN